MLTVRAGERLFFAGSHLTILTVAGYSLSGPSLLTIHANQLDQGASHRFQHYSWDHFLTAKAQTANNPAYSSRLSNLS